METLRNTWRATRDGVRRTVEWRSPLTGLYLMIVNTAFWVSVIYCDAKAQEAMLVTSAAGIFAWDVLLSPSHDKSIVLHLLCWPLQSMWRTTAVGCSLYSLKAMRAEQLQIACWTAYAMLASVLINPVWEYHEVNHKIKNAAVGAAEYTGSVANTYIIHPLVVVYGYVKYIVLLQFIPPMIIAIKDFFSNFWVNLRNLCSNFVSGIWSFFANIRTWFRVQIIDRIKRAANATYVWLRYWFCAEWWPGLKAWLGVHVGQPLKRLFNYFCYGLVYVFCGYWVPPLYEWTKDKLKKLGAIIYKYVLEPTKIFLLRQFDRFRIWLRNQLHRLAIAIRDSVIWPICVLIVDAMRGLCSLVYQLCIAPVINYLYGRYKIIETTALIYFLGPVCEKIVDNIPEKNPLVDDSDEEFDGFLPPENLDDDDQEDVEETSSSLAPSPLPEEEHEFASGLKFPTIHASESSDEEFDLTSNRKVERTKRRRKEDRKDVDHDDEFEYLE